MKYLILPGFSEKNKEWSYELADKLKENGINVEVMEWDHWGSGIETDFDFVNEEEKIIKIVGEKPVGILAKSIGTVIFSRLYKTIPDKFSRIVFMGVPFKSLTDKDKTNFSNLKNLPYENIIVFQNSQDPYGSFKEVREFFAQINPKIQVNMLLRDDHVYPINKRIVDFVGED